MITGEEWEAFKKLFLLILYREHPRPVPHAELHAKLNALIDEHGSAGAALKHMQGELQRRQ